jgi:hypothetical protein
MVSYKEYNGQYVLIQTLELMDEIKKKNPLLQFQVGSNRIYKLEPEENGQRVEVKSSMQVFDAQDSTKPIGGIGYDTDEKYWVHSRLIQNEKYGQWNRRQYHSKYSKHIKNIVKEAVRALKPISYEEVVAENEGQISRVISDICRQTRHKASTKVEVKFADMFEELLHLHNIGYTPANPRFAEAISYAVENKEELQKYYNYSPKKCMIWVRPDSVVYEIGKQIHQVNSTADLPEDMRGKLFVLDVTDNNQFVEDVGIKHEAGVYWVLL